MSSCARFSLEVRQRAMSEMCSRFQVLPSARVVRLAIPEIW